MPLYEYQCETCGQKFEVIQKFADEPLSMHDVCGGKVNRLISAPALQFKGSGWYVNDYAKGSGSSSGASTSNTNASNANNGGGEKSGAEKSSSAHTGSDKSSTPAPASTSDTKSSS